MAIYLQQDTTFSARGQKLFYSRSEVFLLANRNISIRSQKNLYIYTYVGVPLALSVRD